MELLKIVDKTAPLYKLGYLGADQLGDPSHIPQNEIGKCDSQLACYWTASSQFLSQPRNSHWVEENPVAKSNPLKYPGELDRWRGRKEERNWYLEENQPMGPEIKGNGLKLG